MNRLYTFTSLSSPRLLRLHITLQCALIGRLVRRRRRRKIKIKIKKKKESQKKLRAEKSGDPRTIDREREAISPARVRYYAAPVAEATRAALLWFRC